jgi:hypothetical protein
MAWSSAAAWHRRARAARCRATGEGGGVGTARDGVTDRWARMRRGGASHQWLGAARGSVVTQSVRR